MAADRPASIETNNYSSSDGPRSNQFLDRYKAISGQEAYYFIPNGLLEIGNVLGPEAAQNVLQGCLPMLRLSNLDEDFANAISSMERGALRQVDIPTLEQATEPSTSTLAISYRHCLHGSEALPRQRMIDSQKYTLLAAMRSIGTQNKSTYALLWIDQAMGQRFSRSERDWIRHGILPYFAFDVLILREHHDPTRCWLHLEEMIARSYAETDTLLAPCKGNDRPVICRDFISNYAHLFRKNYAYGTIPSIQEVAAEVLSGKMRTKQTHDPNDKEQIMRWAASLLRQRHPLKQLLTGSSWSSRVYDVKGLLTLIRNHQLDESSQVLWRDLSSLNGSGCWHGLSELIGVPDVEAIDATPKQVKEALEERESRYMFNVFTNPGSVETGIWAIAIGCFKCFARPSRIILCALDNTLNEETTHVVSSCILDADKEADTDEASEVDRFLRAFQGLCAKTLRQPEHSVSEVDNMVKTPEELVKDILGWGRLRKALVLKEVFLEEFLECIQAGSVRWG